MENEEIIENSKKISQEILSRGDDVMPMCQVFRKDGKIEIIGMRFDGYNSKEKVREFLKKHILEQEIEKYVITFDAKMTIMSRKEDKEPEVIDVITISVYTPKNKIMRAYPYGKDKKITDNEDDIIKIDKRDGQDSWDIWGEEVKLETKEQKAYQEYKNKHRELYKGTDSQNDMLIDLKNKGKLEIIDVGLDFKLKIYRLEGKIMFEALNAQEEIFLSSKVMEDDNEFKEKLKEVKNVIEIIKDRLNRLDDSK